MEPQADARRRLNDERATALARLESLREEFARLVDDAADANADDEHDIEGTSVPFERDQVHEMLRQAAARVEEVDQALERLDAGTYGTCEVCGQPIGAERLAARPSARACIRCASHGARG